MVSQGFNINLSWLEILVVIEFIESLWPVTVWWTMIFLEWAVGNVRCSCLHWVTLVSSSENTVMWDDVVGGGCNVVIGVRESSNCGMTHPDWEAWVTIVDTVEFLSCDKSQEVVLDNWVLCSSCSLSSSSVSSNGITEGKDVLKSFMLKSVLININEAISIGNSSINKILPWSWWSSETSVVEIVFSNFSCCDIFERSNLLSNIIDMNLNQLLSKDDINVSFVAFIKNNIVGIVEFNDLLSWSNELNSCRFSWILDQFILSIEMLMDESVEVSSFSLIWTTWRVINQIARSMVHAVIVVS